YESHDLVLVNKGNSCQVDVEGSIHDKSGAPTRREGQESCSLRSQTAVDSQARLVDTLAQSGRGRPMTEPDDHDCNDLPGYAVARSQLQDALKEGRTLDA